VAWFRTRNSDPDYLFSCPLSPGLPSLAGAGGEVDSGLSILFSGFDGADESGLPAGLLTGLFVGVVGLQPKAKSALRIDKATSFLTMAPSFLVDQRRGNGSRMAHRQRLIS
jgi:hypothetical protein